MSGSACPLCWAVTYDYDKHLEWHAEQEDTQRRILAEAKRYKHPPTYGGLR